MRRHSCRWTMLQSSAARVSPSGAPSAHSGHRPCLRQPAQLLVPHPRHSSSAPGCQQAAQTASVPFASRHWTGGAASSSSVARSSAGPPGSTDRAKGGARSAGATAGSTSDAKGEAGSTAAAGCCGSAAVRPQRPQMAASSTPRSEPARAAELRLGACRGRGRRGSSMPTGALRLRLLLRRTLRRPTGTAGATCPITAQS